VREHRGQDTETSQQIGAAHDIGDGFGQHRMKSPECSQRDRGAPVLKRDQAERVEQRNIDEMQRNVGQVIARDFAAAAQNRVVEEVGKSGERPVDAAGGIPVQVVFGEDELDVFGGDRLHAGIALYDPIAIEEEAGV
jgi:hypothetical protein